MVLVNLVESNIVGLSVHLNHIDRASHFLTSAMTEIMEIYLHLGYVVLNFQNFILQSHLSTGVNRAAFPVFLFRVLVKIER